MKITFKNDKAIIKIKGSIDSSNVSDIEEEIKSSLLNKEIKRISFDFSDVTYISSAGLRVILGLSKKYEKVTVNDAVSEVYEIFEMTGFTSIINVNRKMREISIDGLKCIGEGSVGKIYRLDADTIVKVFVNADSVKDVLREREMAKKAFVFGAPTAISFDVVKVKEGGYYGAVFEMIKSESYQELFKKHPENIEQYISENVDLFRKITSTDVDPNKFPSKKIEALSWINLLRKNEAFEQPTLCKIEKLINSISDPHKMVHGDLHIKNLMKQENEIVIIDMDTLGYGHSIFELSAIFLAYVAYSETDPDNSMNFLGIPDKLSKKIFNAILTQVYREKSENQINEIYEKCVLLSYINLTYKVLMWETKGNARYEHARQQVLSLINKYESLDY